MKTLFGLMGVALLLFVPSVDAKEVAVFLPVVGPLTPFERSELTKDAVEKLATDFEMRYGDEVDNFVKQAFQEESKKKDCDEANCYRRIAAQYHAEKIVALRVTLMEKGRYLVTFHLYDVATGEMISTHKKECKSCSFEKLRSVCSELTHVKAETK